MRIITETNLFNNAKSPKVKSHNEILDLLNEINSIEENFKDQEKSKSSNDNLFLIGNDELTKTPIDFNEELEFLEVNNNPIIDTQINGDIDHELEFSEVIDNSDIIKETKDVEIQNFNKGFEKHNDVENKPNLLKKIFKPRNSLKNVDDENQYINSTDEIKPIRSTFELKVNDEGSLVGFNIKKPKMESEHPKKKIKLLLNIFSRKSKTEDTKEKSKVVGKIMSIFSRFKLKKSGEESGSKISNILGKIKGIFSRS